MFPARLFTALRLTANPHDSASWRSWIGFGDYLGRSGALSELQAEGRSLGLFSLSEVLEQALTFDNALNNEFFSKYAEIINRYRTGMALFERAQGYSGVELLNYLAQEIGGVSKQIPEGFLQLVSPTTADRDSNQSAKTMVENAWERLKRPAYNKARGVRVGSMTDAIDLDVHTLVIAGFVNGFYPTNAYFDHSRMPLEKCQRMYERDVRLMYCLVGGVKNSLMVSSFKETGLLQAEKLDLKIKRIRMRDGKRVATIEPSLFIEKAGVNGSTA